MKFTKMSLVAALLIGSSAFAIDNVKVSGDAKLYYTTTDAGSKSLFNKGNSTGEAALQIGMTADLTKNISMGVSGTAITTLGLYNNLVSATWTGGVEDTYVINEAWLAATVGKTTGKIGRMELDTPLVFTETWSIVPNTFEAAVVINQDIPDTTLVGAYVGQHDSAQILGDGMNQTTSPFVSFYDGAYTIGAINNTVKPLTVQAWYYGAQTNIDYGTLIQNPALVNAITVSHIDAFWLQADLDAADLGIKGLIAGAQYTKNTYDLKTAVAGIPGSTNNDAYALMLGYNLENVATVKVAYSQVGKDNDSGMGAGFNLATLANGAGILRGASINQFQAQSKLYTEAWWNYGYVTKNDSKAWSVIAEGTVADIDLLAQYTSVDHSGNSNAATDMDLEEFTITAGKDFGPLNATVAYIYTKADDQNDNTADGIANGEAYNTLQAYLTYNF